MGPPGVGKGTQSVGVASAAGVPAISTGDMFRGHLREQTELGLRMAAIIAAGDLIPDDVTNTMIEERLSVADAAAGFVLDGYPRTSAQVDFLDAALAKTGDELDVAILLTADDEVLIERLVRRGREQGRTDDTADVVRHRIELYGHETAPLALTYRERGLLVEVDGVGERDLVAQRIEQEIAARRAS